jgi:single-stranded DNA-binding protein
MTGPSVNFAGNLTDDPEVRHTEGGIARLGVRSNARGMPPAALRQVRVQARVAV